MNIIIFFLASDTEGKLCGQESEYIDNDPPVNKVSKGINSKKLLNYHQFLQSNLVTFLKCMNALVKQS